MLQNTDFESGKSKGYADLESVGDMRYRYKIGIIDFLTKYNHTKNIENKVKSSLNGVESNQISATDQTTYQERFVKFMQDYF